MYGHAFRKPVPRSEALSADGDLKKALHQPAVVDSRPDALVVLDVANDQPGAASLGGDLWGHDGEVGLHVCRCSAVEADERYGELVNNRGGLIVHGTLVSLLQKRLCAVELLLGVGNDHLGRPVESKLADGGGGDFARKTLVAHESFQHHRPHPARLGNASAGVGELHIGGECSSRATGDQGVGASESCACGV